MSDIAGDERGPGDDISDRKMLENLRGFREHATFAIHIHQRRSERSVAVHDGKAPIDELIVDSLAHVDSSDGSTSLQGAEEGDLVGEQTFTSHRLEAAESFMTAALSGIPCNERGPGDHIPDGERFQHSLSLPKVATSSIHMDQGGGDVGVAVEQSSAEDVGMQLKAMEGITLVCTRLEQLQIWQAFLSSAHRYPGCCLQGEDMAAQEQGSHISCRNRGANKKRTWGSIYTYIHTVYPYPYPYPCTWNDTPHSDKEQTSKT
jgi:hypothetical protein